MAFQDLLNKVLNGGLGLRDYRHAAKLFVDGDYRLFPKYAFLFHVFIEINPGVITPGLVDTDSREIGLLVKTVDLPRFVVDTKPLNAYNRPNFAQTKIKYEPVTFTFHDDSANVIRKFWYDYYSYYYRDSDHSEELYKSAHKYHQRQTQDWGYTPRLSGDMTAKENYINKIRIFSFHQKSFSEYVLFNPIISSWQHGKHSQSETTGLLEQSMQVQYESIHYAEGSVISGAVPGFGTLHYDQVPSPLQFNRINSLFRDVANIVSDRKSMSDVQTANTPIKNTVSINQGVKSANATQNITDIMAATQENQNTIIVPSFQATEQLVTTTPAVLTKTVDVNSQLYPIYTSMVEQYFNEAIAAGSYPSAADRQVARTRAEERALQFVQQLA